LFIPVIWIFNTTTNKIPGNVVNNTKKLHKIILFIGKNVIIKNAQEYE